MGACRVWDKKPKSKEALSVHMGNAYPRVSPGTPGRSLLLRAITAYPIDLLNVEMPVAGLKAGVMGEVACHEQTRKDRTRPGYLP